MSAQSVCDICVPTGHGTCVANQSCICFGGFVGIACQDRITTPSTSSVNIAAIIASVLASVLFTVMVGLVIFCIWKRRVKKKSLKLSTTTSAVAAPPASEPVVAPAMYDISLSQQYSGSALTESYHLYDELP